MTKNFYCTKCGIENKNIEVENRIARYVCESCGEEHELQIMSEPKI